MNNVDARIRDVTGADVAALDAALRDLSAELGDTHRADAPALRDALFGTAPAVHACLAERSQGLVGVALFSPLFSTNRGGAGVFVSDLWVAPDRRGSGLGRGLLRAVAERAASLWHVRFLRLIVHDHNARAMALYRDIGLTPVAGETALVLSGPAFDHLRSPR